MYALKKGNILHLSRQILFKCQQGEKHCADNGKCFKHMVLTPSMCKTRTPSKILQTTEIILQIYDTVKLMAQIHWKKGKLKNLHQISTHP